MLGFLIRAAIGLAVAGAAAGIISVVIKGVINKQKVQEQMRSSNVSNFLVEAINNSNNQVKLKDLDTDQEYMYEGEGISEEIYEGEVIYA